MGKITIFFSNYLQILEAIFENSLIYKHLYLFSSNIFKTHSYSILLTATCNLKYIRYVNVTIGNNDEKKHRGDH